jgi:hypothetical protein
MAFHIDLASRAHTLFLFEAQDAAVGHLPPIEVLYFTQAKFERLVLMARFSLELLVENLVQRISQIKLVD